MGHIGGNIASLNRAPQSFITHEASAIASTWSYVGSAVSADWAFFQEPQMHPTPTLTPSQMMMAKP